MCVMTTTNYTLYAWANPLSFAPFFDHTWVTDYSFTNNEYPTIGDIPDGANYWYCWGIYHPSGSGGVNHNPNGAIGQAASDQTMATSLVTSNTPPPSQPGEPDQPQDGSITFYAVDGVCHNVANQVLYATGTSDTEPIRVKEARGYDVSSFLYTNYGLNTTGWNALKSSYAPDVKEPGDDFSDWFEQVLGEKVTLKQVLAVTVARAAAQLALQKLHQDVQGMTAKEVMAAVGVIVLAALTAIYKTLGSTDFHILFPSFPTLPSTAQEAVSWIDPAQLEESVALLQ